MDVALKVTDQPQESCFYDLVSGDNVLSIPLFQRPYRWQKKNLEWLWADINDIRDDAAKSVFLGVIVCVVRGASPGRPIPWEIVDGQQRLTTLYLLLMAAAETFARNGHPASAAAIIGTYLLVRPLAHNPINTKLIPSFADRSQFKKIWDQMLLVPGLATDPTIIANQPKTPPPSGSPSGPMLSQHGNMRKMLQKLWATQGKDALDALVEISANRLSVVSISLRDPIVAPKIFERLNNRAELVTTADLVRNEVFSRASDDPANAQSIFETQWEPFAQKFSHIEGGLEKFLFPYGLILKSTVTKADLFSQIRSHWSNLTGPQQIIEDMEKYVDIFMALEAGHPTSQLSEGINKQLLRIHRLGKPSSTYTFIMRLGFAVKINEISDDEARDILLVLEDFLFRRAICGIEPTGLHAVFKGLWSELSNHQNGPEFSAVRVKAAISAKPTIAWPNNEEFIENIKLGDLYHRKVSKFALREYEAACAGDSSTDNFHIEHVLPQTITPHWQGIFGSSHSALCNTWANLVPLSAAMNPSVGQGSYEVKRAAFLNSMFSSARSLANNYETWTPDSLKQRAASLAEWAVSRWPNSKS